MPTIIQTVNGKVTALWGSALRRTTTGKLVSLKMGDLVNRGDVILTTQDGIVQLTPNPDAPRTAAAAPETDLDRVIAELNEPDALTAPAAGLNAGDGAGLTPGLRVGRISEDITPASFTASSDTTAARPVQERSAAQERSTAPAAGQAEPPPVTPVPSNANPTATTAAASGNEDSTLPVALTGQDSDGSVVSVTIVSIPAGSALLLADGVTPVVAGQTLTAVQAAGLLFSPAPDFNGGVAVGFTVTDNLGAVSAPATVQINVLSVNDTPLANPGIASVGPEYSNIPVNLTGTDIDGSVVSVSVTTLPSGGTLFLADGATPVVPGTVLTPAQASQLVFVPNPGSTGSATIGFTVTDNEGATSAPTAAQVNVTPVPTTVTLTASASTVAEGGSVVYSAAVDHPVNGSPLVITLSNGSTITIPVGQSSGSSAPVVPRADDAYAQGSQTQTVAVAGTAGGNFSSLVTGSTIGTTVTDDVDATTVSLSASAASVTEGGSVVYTATVNNPVTGSPLVVTLSNGQTITIPVGQSSGNSAPVVLRPDDADLQGPQTVNTAITGTSGGNFEAVSHGPAVDTTVTDDADASTVTLSASATTVAEGGSIVYTASLSSPVAGAPLVVTLTNGQTITIPVGQSSGSSAPFAVRPDDAAVQGTETLTVDISTTTGGNFEALTPIGTATTTVTDDADASTVTLSASANSVAEGGSITYTAGVSGLVTGSPLVVTLSNGQTITIPVGQSSASSAPFAVRTDDAQLQGTDTLSVNISATSGGNYEALTATGTATTTVTDDADATTATLTASAASVTEGGSIVYTATLNNTVVGSPLVLTLSNGQTITIPVGQSSGSSAPFAVRADDALVQGTDTLNVNIATTAGGNFEAVTPTGTAITTVSDDADPTTVTLSASAANVSEGGSIVYTATLSNAVTGSPLVITLSNGQTINIAVGQSSGSSAPFAVRPDDANVQPDDTLTVNVAGSTGGNFEALTATSSATTTVSDDADVSTVTLSSSAASVTEGGSVVYTASVNNPVVGTPLVISLNNGQSIVIPVGQSTADSAPFAVRTDDNFVQGAQSFSVNIAGTTGGSYEALAITSTVSTTVNDDADTSTVSLSASPSVAEGGSIVYTATLSAAAETAVTVTLSNGSIINIAAGDSFGTVAVAAPTDDVVVDAGTVSATIASATGGNFESLVVSPVAAVTTITDTLDTTTISITGSASVSEAGTANYTLSLTSPAQTDVTVTLTYSGTAANGSDFTGTTTVTIPAGASLASFSVAAIDDVLAEGPEGFTVAIGSATGGNFENLVVSGSAGSVSTGIVDNDISTVSLSATPSLSEAGGNIVYTATLAQAPVSALTVILSNGAVINVAAGALSGTVSVPVAASEDVYVDPTSLSATIASTSGGGIPLAVDPAAAVTAITDTIDTTTVSLAATPAIAEGGSIVYTASLTSPAGTQLTVNLSNGAQIVIAAGASSGTVSVLAPTDDVHVDAASVSATITSTTGGNFESLVVNPTPAVTAVTDTIDTTTVSLTADNWVIEGTSITYTASLTAPAGTDVTVNLSNGAQITIAAGTSSGSVVVNAPGDDVHVDAADVSVSIVSASGGNFENLAVSSIPAITYVVDSLDTTTLSLTASPTVAEGGSIVYTASLTSPADTLLTVTLSNGAQITIAAGAATGSVSVAAPGEDFVIDAGSVSATITSASGGNFENLAVDPAAATTSVTDTIDTTTVSLTSSPLVAEGGNIVYTASLTSPAGTALTVTLSNGAQINIAAGASTGSVSVAAPSEDFIIDAGTVSATITATSGGNFESLAVNPAAATTAITDTIDTTTVSLTATASVAEGGSIVYTASLTSPAGTAVTVLLSNGAQIDIAAGASTGSVSVPAPSEDFVVDAGTVSTTISSATGGNFENLAVDPAAATTAVTDTVDTTTVTLTASTSVAEGGSIVYTASLTSAAAAPVTVTLSNGAQIVIATGDSVGTVSVFAPSEDVYLDAGSVSATITSATGGNFENLAVNPAAASSAITDTIGTTTVSLTGDGSVAEGASASYTVSLTSPAQTAVTITLSYSGTAADGTDFTGITTVTIPATSSSASFSIATLDDVLAEGAENFTVAIASATGGNFENLVVSAANGSVSTGIVDNDISTISLSATSSITEAGGGIVYTATLTQAPVSDLSVTLSNGAVITVTGGSLSGSVTVPVAADEDVVVDATSVSASITNTSGGGIALAIDPTPASTAITDTIDTTTVSLAATPSVAEGGAIVYTASLTSAAQTAVVVNLSNGLQINIAAGASSGTVSTPAPAEDALLDAGSVSASITSASGGNFESLLVNPAPAVTSVTDTVDTTTLSLSATPSVAEGGSIVYTASLNNAAGTQLTVTLSNGAQIVIAAGASSGSVSVSAPGEDALIDASTLSATITATSGGNFENLAVDPSAATTAITDTIDTTTVSLTATASVTEGGSIVYTASLNNPAGTQVTVNLSNGAQIVIAAGASTGTVSVPAPAEDALIDAGPVSAQITSATGGNFENLAVNPAVATTTVTDTVDTTTVSLTATPTVAEGGSIVYTASLNNLAGTTVTVNLSNGAQIVIAAGASVGTVSVPAPDDDAIVDAGSVSAQITSATGGNFESLVVNPAPAVTSVTDTLDTTTVSLTASPSVAEGGNIVYTASLNNAAGTAVTVTLSNGAQISIAAGASSGTVSVPAPADDALIDAGTVSATITGATGGNFENLAVNPAAATTSVTDTLDTTTASLTATATVAEGGSIVYTATLTEAAGTQVTLDLSNGAQIVIAAGASSGTVSVPAPAEDVYIDAGSVSATITAASGGNFENLVVSPAPATTNITDTVDTATVSLTATATVAEGGSIVYTASLSHPAGTDVTVTLSNGAQITIAAGASTGTASVATAANDPLINASTVSATITAATGGNFENLVADPAPATTAITDTIDTTTVSLTATPSVAEGGSIVYTASLTSAAGTPVTVNLSNGAQIVIAAGASSGTVAVPAPAEDVYVDAGTTSATIVTATGGNFESLAINPAAANTSVTDTIGTTTLSLTGDSSVAEGANASYTVSLTNPAQTAVTVTLSYSGTAANGTDFTGVSTVTIPANASSANFSIATLDDALAEGAENFTVAIASATGGNFENLVVSGSAGSVSTGIVDNDISTISLSATTAITEAGGSIVYTATLTQAPVSALTVNLANGAVITVAAGALTGTVSVPVAASEDVYLDPSSISTTIASTSGGGIAVSINPAVASTAVNDTIDTTTVSLSATPTVAEGGSIVYTATLTSAAQTAVVVMLSNGAQINIAAGASTGTVSVQAPDEDAHVDAGSVSATITSASGGNFENLVRDPAAAVTSITDTIDTTTVSLTATPSVAEGGSIVYTASLNNPAGTAFNVTLSNGEQITIAAGASTGTVSVLAPADDALVDAGSVSATITATSGGNFENLAVNPAPAVTAVTDTIDTTTVSLTATPSVAEGGSIVYTASLTSPAGTLVTVTLSNGAQISIAAGASSGTASVLAPSEDFVVDAGPVSATITAATGGNFENLAINPAAATTSVTDTIDTTTVSLSATPSVAEGGSIVYTASLTAAADSPVTVNLSNGQQIVIANGASSGTVSVLAPTEDVHVDAGPVSATITGATGGNFENLVVDAAPAVTAVSDTINTTTLSLTGSGSVAEGASASYTVSLTSPAQTAVTITLSYSGTAANGADFSGVATVTIPATGSSANFSIGTLDDALAEGAENFTVAIASATGGNFENLVVSGSAGSVTTGIVDNDDSTVSLSATASITEAGGNTVYTATLTQAPVSALTITLSNGAVINVAAGALTGTVSVPVAASDDVVVDPTSISATIASTSGGGIGLSIDPTPATTAIVDTIDATTVTLTASAASVTEGGSIVYTATASNPVTGSPLVVSLSNGQQITIPVGQSTGSSGAFAVRADDADLQGTQTINVTITGTSGGNFEAVTPTGTATTTVSDDADATTVTLTASAATVAEGGSISYTASVNNPVTGSALVITLTNGQQITIPVGQSSGTSPAFAVRGDDAYVQGTQTLTVGVLSTSGGNFESLTTTSTASTTVTDDSDATTVNLTASAASVAEGGSITYTATVNNPVTGSALVISLDNGQTITIPVGQSSASSTAFVVRADDADVQGTQTLSVTITGTTGGNFEAATPTGTATTTVTDDADTTTVSITASAATVTEGGSIVYTVTASNLVTGSALVVTLSNGQQVTIPVGQSSATSTAFVVRADDASVQGTQTLNITITGTTGASFEAVTPTGTATTTVTDDADATTITLTASAASVVEGGSLTYTATLSNAVTGSPLVINLDNGQQITIPVGQSSGTTTAFAVRADEAYVQGTQTLTVGVSSTSGGSFEALTTTSTASSTVTDDSDATTVSISASASSVTEGGSIVYTATVNNPVTGSALVVTLSNGQQITIPVGQSSGSSAAFAVRADDADVQGTQTLNVTITGTTGGNYEAVTPTGTATTTVTDDADATTVSITASAATVAESGSIIYTATLSNAVTGSPLVITLTNGQQITIPVGQSTGNSPAFAVRADDAYVQGTQTLNVGVSSTAGANYEALTPTTTASTTVTDDSDTTTVSISASAASVTEGGSIVYTATASNAVTGSPLVVTLSNGQQITIPVGQSSGTSGAFAVRADDAYVQGTQTLNVTITGTTGGNYEAVTPTGTATTAVTDDSDASTVTLTASAASVAEGGSVTYTAVLNNAVTGAPLVIMLTNGQQITIPVGQSSGTTTAFAVRADDAYVQGTQTLTVGVSSTSGGNFEALTTTSTASTTVTDDADATTVTLTASAATVTEGGSIVYTATVSNAVTGTPLTINLNNGQTITIPVGQTSASSPAFGVRVDDAYVQGTQTLTVGIGSTSGGNFEALTTSSTATTTVTDDTDTTTVTLTASAATVSEGGSITYTATVNNPVTGSALVISLNNGQTITIPVGQSSASSPAFAVRVDDAYLQGTQTLTVGITGTTGGNYEARTTTSTATTTVTDDADASVVMLSVSSASVTEGGSVVYTATVNNAVTGSPLVINLDNGQQITIPVGQSSASSPAYAVRSDDAYTQGAQPLVVGISSTSGGSYEALTTSSTATITVNDDADPTTVSISASAASVAEGGTVTYTATLSNAVTGSPLVINLTNGQQITIPVGQSSGTSPAYTPRADDAYVQGTQAVSVGVSSTSGGNFESLTTTSTASVNVSDDADTTTVSLTGSGSVTEGANASYTLTLSNPASTAVTVTLSYSGTAANGTDYTGVATVTIPAGASSASFNVPTTNDTLDEPNETLVVSINTVSGGGFEAIAAHPTNNAVTTTINDNDPTPSLAIGDVTVNEAAGTATFTVTLSAASGQTVTVNYGTSNDGATAGSDYTATSGTLTFAPGVVSRTITVNITNDTLAEATETFNVNLSGAVNATIADALGVGSIIDNDAPPAIDLDANNSSASGSGYTTTFVENGAAVSIADTDIAIADVDSSNLTSATITLTNAQAGDVLAAGGMPAGITASAVGNVVTLSGSATLASYQTAIRAITFANTSENPSTADRLINVVVNDGTSSSAAATAVVHVTAVNDAPAATGAAVSGTEDTALVFTWSNFGVTDIDTASSALGIRVATLPADGTLQTFNGSAWVNASAGSVISKATIDAGSFRFVPDSNESGADAYGGSSVGNQQADYARFTFTPNDGATDGATATVRIDITPVADAPTLTHSVASQVTGTLSTLTSVGLSRDYYQAIATLASGPSSTNPDTGETGIETAVPTSSSLITNVGVAGNLSNDTGVQVAADDAYRVQGLIYLEAGRSYTFSGYADDTVRLEVGGTMLLSGQWGGSGQAATGTFTSSTLTPAVTGYYSLEFMVYNTSGPGSYDLNLSVDGATAVDLSTANFQLYQSITQVDAAGGQRSDFVPNAGTGEGGYYSVVYNSSVQSRVYLAPVLASLADTDGSESLAVQMQGVPVGAVLSDGTNTFTATAASTSVNITTWDRAHLSLTLPSGFTGTTNMTAVATSTEATTGTTAVTSVNVPVTVEATNLGIPLDEIATFNADALIGQAGADVYSVSQSGTGLAVTVSQGATGSIPAQTGTETTGTIHQAFSTGAGNDYVQSGAGDDTIYLGDSGSATHPVSGNTATQANVAATRIMTLADNTTLTDATTGLLTNEADDTTSSNGSGNTSITTWSDVANGGSGNDAIYGQAGTDFIYGGTGNDYLNGGAGIDGLRGGAGNDTLVGGAGNDVLRGDAGADVFRWEFGDQGTAGTPASDIVTDFNNATPAAGGDVLDLRDLLQGEATVGGNAGNLANYLHFTVSGGNTTIQISSSGAYSGGFNAGATDQSITLQGVDLTASGTFNTDQQIIQDLLSKSKLIVDGS